MSTLVDDDAPGWIFQVKWTAKPCVHTFYAMRRSGSRMQYLHRVIAQANRGECVDHLNGNGLDNQKANLRIVSVAENFQGFQRKRQNKTSQYRGVCWVTTHKKWVAKVHQNGTTHWLGYYDDEEEAAMAFDKKARELGRVNQSLNFKEGGDADAKDDATSNPKKPTESPREVERPL